MDSINIVDKELERVLSKFNSIQNQTSTNINDLLLHIDDLKSRFIEDGVDDKILATSNMLMAGQCIKKAKDSLSRLSSDHKDLHANVSKVGKTIDKNFVSDFNAVYVDGAFSSAESMKQINRVICDHLLRQGMLNIAESLVHESGIELDEYEKEPFLQIHNIIEALSLHNLQPALQWVNENREMLLMQNSRLEFRLHRLYFLELLKGGMANQPQLLNYSANFAPFAFQFKMEIQILMGALVYLRTGLVGSPYEYLLSQASWTEMVDIFMEEACSLLGLTYESHLNTVIKAGCSALPPLLTLKQVMQQRQYSSVWSAKDELPVEVDLGQSCRFHSIFACPILRQQSSDTNPPVRLICGHAISKDALSKLSSANKWALLPLANKVKCPYCPIEQSPLDAKQLYF